MKVYIQSDAYQRGEFDHDNLERYTLERNWADFIEWIDGLTDQGPDLDMFRDHNNYIKGLGKEITELTEAEFEDHPLFDDWRYQADEEYHVPMVNYLRVLPSYLDETDLERLNKNAHNTTFIHDDEDDSVALAMTGAGMDMLPYIIKSLVDNDLPINPSDAAGVTRDYSAYISSTEWQGYCDAIAEAMRSYGESWINRADNLMK